MADRAATSCATNTRVTEACGASCGVLVDTQRVVIVMPHPPSSLSPNARVHWRVRARDAARVRREAFCLTRQAIWDGGIDSHPWDAAVMDIEWRFSGRQSDSDNVVTRVKAARDGIADACLVRDDKYVVIGSITMERVRRSEQAVVLTLTRLDAENGRQEAE